MWTDRDGALFTALTLYEDDLCPGCRQPLSYTTPKETEGHWAAHQLPACQSCEVIRKQGDKAGAKPWHHWSSRPDVAVRYAMQHPTDEQVGWLPTLARDDLT